MAKSGVVRHLEWKFGAIGEAMLEAVAVVAAEVVAVATVKAVVGVKTVVRWC